MMEIEFSDIPNLPIGKKAVISKGNVENNYTQFRKIGLTRLPLLEPSLSAINFSKILSSVAKRDASTALSLCMHLFTLIDLQKYHRGKIPHIIQEICENGAYIASLNDPGLYFIKTEDLDPDKFANRVRKVEGGYVLNGRKSFVSTSSFADYFPVYGLYNNENGDNCIIVLVVSSRTDGVEVANDWNTISMAETESNTVIFKDVFVPDADIIIGPEEDFLDLNSQGFYHRLGVASVYQGLSIRAFEVLLQKLGKSPKNTKNELRTMPHIQAIVGEIAARLSVIDTIICDFATALDEAEDANGKDYDHLNKKSLATKFQTTESVDQIIKLCTEAVGIGSLSRGDELSSIFMDSLAYRFHPPQRAMLLEMMGKFEVGIDLTCHQRWG